MKTLVLMEYFFGDGFVVERNGVGAILKIFV